MKNVFKINENLSVTHAAAIETRYISADKGEDLEVMIMCISPTSVCDVFISFDSRNQSPKPIGVATLTCDKNAKKLSSQDTNFFIRLLKFIASEGKDPFKSTAQFLLNDLTVRFADIIEKGE